MSSTESGYNDTTNNVFRICLLGERLLTQKSVTDDLGVIQCNKNVTGPIFYNYCGNTTLEQATNSDDPYCMYFMNNSVRYIPGIPGLTSGVFKGKVARYILNE